MLCREETGPEAPIGASFVALSMGGDNLLTPWPPYTCHIPPVLSTAVDLFKWGLGIVLHIEHNISPLFSQHLSFCDRTWTQGKLLWQLFAVGMSSTAGGRQTHPPPVSTANCQRYMAPGIHQLSCAHFWKEVQVKKAVWKPPSPM